MTGQKFVGAIFVAAPITLLCHAPFPLSWALGLTLFIGILMLADEEG